MSVLKPRSRLVYFRVSEDEFQLFNHLRESTGARSLSDLARTAIQGLLDVGQNKRPDWISDRLTLLENMVRELNHGVVQLTRVLGNGSHPIAPPDTSENCNTSRSVPEAHEINENP